MSNEAIAGTANALVSLVGLLVDDLDAKGVISKKDFAENLRAMIRMAKEQAGPDPGQRFDWVLLDRAASWLDDPSKGWSPVVIPGGKESP